MSPFPLHKHLSEPLTTNLPKKCFQLISSLFASTCLIFEALESVLELLKVCLSYHSHDVERSNFFIISIDILSRVWKCFNSIEWVKQYLRSHVLLKSTDTFCEITYVSVLVTQSPNYSSLLSLVQFIDEYLFSGSLILGGFDSTLPNDKSKFPLFKIPPHLKLNMLRLYEFIMLDHINPGHENIRLIFRQKEVEGSFILLLLNQINMILELHILFIQLHHGICKLLFNFWVWMKFPFVECI